MISGFEDHVYFVNRLTILIRTAQSGKLKTGIKRT